MGKLLYFICRSSTSPKIGRMKNKYTIVRIQKYLSCLSSLSFPFHQSLVRDIENGHKSFSSFQFIIPHYCKPLVAFIEAARPVQ